MHAVVHQKRSVLFVGSYAFIFSGREASRMLLPYKSLLSSSSSFNLARSAVFSSSSVNDSESFSLGRSSFLADGELIFLPWQYGDGIPQS